MKKKVLRSLLVVSSLVHYLFSYSQTATTIVYSGSSLSNINNCPQCCNVFNQSGNNPTVNGVPHYPVSGGATFDGTSIKMETKVDGATATNSGTAYALGYTFKTGNFSYKIDIDAGYTANPTTAFPKITLSLRTALPNPGDTDPTACGPVNNSKWSSSIGSIVSVIYPTQLAVKTYNVSSFVVPAQQSYLVVTVSDGGANTTTALINKIVITEIAPSFTVSSSAPSIACGATTPITFTVNNINNSTGITGYTFNLGANNGWLYNGIAAPPTIPTGTSSTITLTPDCGKALSGVSATVAVGSTNYNSTNSSTVTTSAPSLSISGNSLVCSGATNYTINGLPCNATFLWAQPPVALGSLSTLNSSPTTFTYGGTPGNFTLSADVTSCGSTQTVTLPVHAGPYTSNDYTMSWNAGTPPYYCLNQTITFTVNGAVGSNYSWSPPYGWTLVYNGGSYAVLRTPPSTGYPPTGSVTVTFTEPCGSTVTKSFQTVYSSSYCGTSSSPYTISPNPASSTITIACASLQTYCNISAVQITDLYGTVKASQSWQYTNQSVQMNVSFLANGTYIAKVYDGSQWYSNQFIVQH